MTHPTSKLLSLLLAMSMLLGIASIATAQEAEPFTISLLLPLYGNEPVSQDSPVLNYIEAYTNTKLDITWVPRATYNEKLYAMIASGTVPMIVTIKNNKESAVVNAVRDGAFWEIGPLLDGFDNLRNLTPGTLANLYIDGKLYSLYGERELTRNCYILRKDWLDALGLEMPKNLAQMQEVARAFTHGDPDGNGLDDTYGFMTNPDPTLNQYGVFGMCVLSVVCGAPNGFGFDERDQLVPSYFFDGYKEGLDFYRTLYEESVLDPTFAICTETDKFEAFLAGKVGMMFLGNTRDSYNRVVSVYNRDYPDGEAEFAIYSAIEDGNGDIHAYAGSGFSGTFSYATSAIPDEETLLKVLDFQNKLCDPQMQDALTWGIEGVHYQVSEDGTASFISDEAAAQYAVDLGDLDQMRLLFTGARLGVAHPIMNDAIRQNEEQLPYAVLDPSLALVSDTYTERSTTLNTILYDATVNYIMGNIDGQGLVDAGEEWLAQGGAQVIQEYTEAYRQANP